RDEGYNAVIGNYWWLAYRPDKLINQMLRRCARSGYPIPFFAAPESHNTPRAAARPGGLKYARLVWALGCLMPALPFCHAGFEIAEVVPVNTGLDFEREDLSAYPAEKLPLFSEAAYSWESEEDLLQWIQRVLDIRVQYADLITDSDPTTFGLVASDNPNVWAVVRHQARRAISILFNLTWEVDVSFRIRLPTDKAEIVDLLSQRTFALNRSQLEATFEPAECVIATW
ncbi:MAG: hypothetical protein PVJ64_17135, partial [Gemmatimonadales bacterium]